MTLSIDSASFPDDQIGNAEDLLSFTIAADSTHVEISPRNPNFRGGSVRVAFGLDASALKGVLVEDGETRLLPVAVGSTSLKVYCGSRMRVSVTAYAETA